MKFVKTKTISFFSAVSLCAALFVWMFFPLVAGAAVPEVINYQSRLRTLAGVPISSSTQIQFSLYKHISNGLPSDIPGEAGPLVWQETYDQVSGTCAEVLPDAQGYFYVKLGSCVNFPSYIKFDEPLYLGVKIEADPEAAPRVLLAAFPYALNTKRFSTFIQATTTPGVLAESLGIASSSVTGVDSSALLFQGSGWNGVNAVYRDIKLKNIVTDANVYRFSLSDNAGMEMFSVDNSGLASTTNLAVTNNVTIRGIALSDTGTDNLTSGAYLIGAYDEFDNSSATTVQAVLNDLDAVITAVSSSLYAMDLQQVTDNGATTTNWIQFSGATSTGDFNPAFDLNFSLGTTSERWNQLHVSDVYSILVSSTEAYFTAVTTTNLFADLFGFNTATGSDLNVTNATTVNSYITNLTALSGNITDLITTNVTTTNIFGTNATFTNLYIENPTSLTDIIWVNATGTNTTSTNLYASSFTSDIGTITSLNFGYATGVALTLSSYLAINGIQLDAVGMSPTSSGAYLVGVFDEFMFSNATTVQAVLYDLDTALAAVSSTISNFDLQQVTDNGNLTTNAIEFAGGTSTDEFLVSTSKNFGSYGLTVSNNPTITGSTAIKIARSGSTSTIEYGGGGNAFSVITPNGSNSYIAFSPNGYMNSLRLGTNGYAGFNVAFPTLFQVQVAGHVGPNANNLYDLGSPTTSWRNIYASGTIYGNITGYINPGYTEGSVIFQGAAGLAQNNSNFYWDDGAARLLIGTKPGSNTSTKMHVSGNAFSGGSPLVTIKNTFGGGGGKSLLVTNDPGNVEEAMLIDNQGTGTGLVINNLGAGNLYGLVVNGGNVGFGTSTPNWFKVQIAGSLGPDADNLYDLGSATTSWRNVYSSGFVSTTALYIDGVNIDSQGTNTTSSGAYLMGVYDGFTNFNATTVQAALEEIDVLLSSVSSSSSDAYFVGLTAAAYPGSFSSGTKIGYQAANDICANEYPNSHFCRTDEIIGTVADRDVSALFVAATYGWIAEGPPGYTASSNDCTGYTTSSNLYLGAFWAYDPNGGGAGWLNNCSVTRKISCCKR